MLLGDLAHRGTAPWPSRTAFVWDGRRRTYGELRRGSSGLRAVFAAAGVRHGSRVALLTPNTPEAPSLNGSCAPRTTRPSPSGSPGAADARST